MGAQTDEFDLGSLRLAPGEGRRLSLDVSIAPLVLGSETYRAEPARVPVSLEVSRMLGGGYALRLGSHNMDRHRVCSHPRSPDRPHDARIPGSGRQRAPDRASWANLAFPRRWTRG